MGNAERFADTHLENVRYVSAWKKWIFWNGKRWIVGADDQVRRMAHTSVKSLYNQAAKENDADMAAKLAKWAAQSCRSSSITAMLKETAALLSIDSTVLDSNPWLFNCNNITIDLESGGIRPYRREDYITKIAPIDFNPDAECPLFIEVVHRCLDGDLELIEFVQRFFGYCLSGSTREQIIVIFHGLGANGKTVILSTTMRVLGDYAQTTRPETLMVKYGNQIPSDLAKLKGARFVVASESEDGHRLAESAIKAMTGGEKIQARALYADWFEYQPEFKILLCTNHKPTIRGNDHAIWRRIRLVPFTITIPEGEQDKDLPEKLKAELPGILRWIVEGAAKWLSLGLGCPEKVQTATRDYQSEQNVIKTFLEYCCTERQDAACGAKDLFTVFEKWRSDEGHPNVTQTKFGRMLSDIGFEKTRQSGTGRMIYTGIGLLQDTNHSQNG